MKLAEAFLPEVDTLSTTDVVHKVNALNEILQAAALLGEMLQSTERTDRTQKQITEAEAFEKARCWVNRWQVSCRVNERMDGSGPQAALCLDRVADCHHYMVQVCGLVVEAKGYHHAELFGKYLLRDLSSR